MSDSMRLDREQCCLCSQWREDCSAEQVCRACRAEEECQRLKQENLKLVVEMDELRQNIQDQAEIIERYEAPP